MHHRPWPFGISSHGGGFDEGPIQVRVAGFEQLFNPIDPTPLPERSLNPDIANWIEEWAEELDSDEDLTVEIHVAGLIDARMEAAIASSFRSYFEYREWQVGRQLRRLLRDGRISLLIGVVALAVITMGARLIGESSNAGVDFAREGLAVLGWVSMWRPLETLLYAWWPVRRERSACRRLVAATVVFPRAPVPAR